MSESSFWSNFWSKGWEDSNRESVKAIDYLFHRSPIEHFDALYNFFGDVFGTIILSIGILITYFVLKSCYRRIGRLWFLKNKSKFEKFIFQSIVAISLTAFILFGLYIFVYVAYQLIILIFIFLAWLGKGIPAGGSTITGTHTTDHMIFEDDETRRQVKKTKDTFS